MSFVLPPVVRLAENLLAEIERAVRQFSRYDKFAHGAELRGAARAAAKCAHRAWRDRSQLGMWTARLVVAVDDVKLELQTCQRLHSFRSFAQFEALSRLSVELGRQAGGWNRRQHPNGQNRATAQPSRERAEILSTRATSSNEVNA